MGTGRGGFSVSRWTVGKYRAQIYRYGAEYLDVMFAEFVKAEAVALAAGFDSTPMRIFTGGCAASFEIYVKSLEAMSADGKRMVTYPTVSQPECSKVSGLLSTIPLPELHIDDLLDGQGFRFLLLKSDGANVNRSAIKMLTAELQNRKELLVAPVLCIAHALNNSSIWGLGDFPFGSVLRTAHVFEARHLKELEGIVSSVLRCGVGHDPILERETAQ